MPPEIHPVIGVTADNQDNTAASGTYESAAAYSRAVDEAGGLPVVLPHAADRVAEYVALCDGLILTGGVDPDTTAFGQPMHPKARAMDPTRQAFELGLLEAVRDAKPQAAVLGVCLGMQLMALHAGGALDQYMPETMGDEAAAAHTENREHPINLAVPDSQLGTSPGKIVSSHRQRVSDTGSMRLIAAAPDGTVEAIDDPARPFYVGVQWHPERGRPGSGSPLNLGLIRRLVSHAGA